MKQCILALCLLLGGSVLRANPIVQFRISRSLCLLNFLEASANDPQSSSTYRKLIERELGADTAFQRLRDDFRNTGLYYTYRLPEYPEARTAYISTTDLIRIAAVQCSRPEEFLQRIIGVLPNANWMRLKNCMERAASFYDRIVVPDRMQRLEEQKRQLEILAPQVNSLFLKLRTFYGSSWTEDIPFTVALYSIPSPTGASAATPHANSLIMGLLSGDGDASGQMGIGIHEICHVLYREQPLRIQEQFDSFMTVENPYAPFAYDFINEGLATACGNGWAYRMLSGKTDTGEWYNNRYINAYAKALYPLVSNYLDAGRTMDRTFADSAIALFARTFPGAPDDLDLLLNNFSLYTDAEQQSDLRQVLGALQAEFSAVGYMTSAPLLDEKSLSFLKESKGTQVIVVHSHHAGNRKALQKLFPELAAHPAQRNEVLVFRDRRHRPVILVDVADRASLEAAFRKLKQVGKVTPALKVYRIG